MPEGNIRAFQYDTIGANVSLFFYMDTLRKIEISASTILSGRQNSIDGDMIDIFKESVTVLLGEADRVIRLDCYDNNGLLSKEMARKKIEKAEQFRRNNKGQLNPYLNFSCEYEYQWRTNKTELRLIYMFRVYRRLDYSILQLAYNERINREINSIDIKIKEEIRINNIINDSIKKVEEIKKAYPSLPMNDVAVDVKKTDSLASPYVGEMTFLTVNRGFSDEGYVAESDATMRLQYALQDGEWAFKGGEMSESNWRVVRDTSDKFGAQVVASLNKRTHGSAGIATEELLDSVLKEFNKNLERKK